MTGHIECPIWRKGLRYGIVFIAVVVLVTTVQIGYSSVQTHALAHQDSTSLHFRRLEIDPVNENNVRLGNTELAIAEARIPPGGKLPAATIKHHVLINSYMSCGSRFTGKSFGFRNDSFYFYEPLWHFNVFGFYVEPDLECDVVGAKQTCRKISGAILNKIPAKNLARVKKEVSGLSVNPYKFYQTDDRNASVIDILTDVLTDIYNCRFDRIINVVVDSVHGEEAWAGPSWQVYRDCRKEKSNSKLDCLRRLEEVCRKADHVVTKVLRIATGALEKLMDRVKNLKLLHLNRDPRAIINSRREWKGYPITDGFDNSRKLCVKMKVDFVGGVKLMDQFPQRVKFVFYEDIMSDVEYKTKEVYKFIGMDAALMKFENAGVLKKISNEAPEDSNVSKMAELRKKNNAFWWRQNLPFRVYGIVQDQCSSVVPLFNLTSYDTEESLRDMSIPSMNLPDIFVIL